MSNETDPNTKEANKIGMDMIYQVDITDYMNRIRQFKKYPQTIYIHLRVMQ